MDEKSRWYGAKLVSVDKVSRTAVVTIGGQTEVVGFAPFAQEMLCAGVDEEYKEGGLCSMCVQGALAQLDIANDEQYDGLTLAEAIGILTAKGVEDTPARRAVMRAAGIESDIVSALMGVVFGAPGVLN